MKVYKIVSMSNDGAIKNIVFLNAKNAFRALELAVKHVEKKSKKENKEFYVLDITKID